MKLLKKYKAFAALLIFFGVISESFAQNLNRPVVSAPGGFSVNSYTGNLYYKRTDITIPGRIPIDISFSYNSRRRAKDWGMGHGWTFTYNMAYAKDNLGIYIERMDGKRHLFKKSGARYISPIGIFDSLFEYQTNKFCLKSKDGSQYFFDNNIHKKLTKLQDRNGNAITLGYTDTLLSTITDASNRTCTIKWNKGHIQEIIDQADKPDRKFSYSYDTLGNLQRVTNPLNYSVIYYYDDNNKVIGITDKRGYNMSIGYNINKQVQKIVSCLTTQTFSYVPSQNTTFVTENVRGGKQTTIYQYDSSGQLMQKKGNCCGFNLSYEYDSKNNITGIKDGTNNITNYEYDSKGNVMKETDALGFSTVYTYEALHNMVKTITDKRDNTTTHEYDTRGNLKKVLKPLDVIELYRYDSDGNMLSSINGNGDSTVNEYDANGYLKKATDAEGATISYQYDKRGNRISQTDAKGYTTNYSFDALNRLMKITDPLSRVKRYGYDPGNNLVADTNALNKVTVYEYDGLSRPIKKTTPLKITTETQYDELGNITERIDGNRHKTTYTYNSRNQVLSETDALGNTLKYEYDEGGNLITAIDKKGQAIKYTYDNLKQLTKVINAKGDAVMYTYDANGNRITETDAIKNITQFDYDAVNRLKKITDALNNTIIYTYDKAGNRTSIKDKNENITSYTYDKVNRLKTVTDAHKGVTKYFFDANGNLTGEENQLKFVTKRGYDRLDRLVTIFNALKEKTIYTYDAIGNLKTINQPNGNIITNTYDDDNRLKAITDLIGPVRSYTYDKNNNIKTETDGNGFLTTYGYDALNRKIKHTDALKRNTIFRYDVNGNLESETNAKGNSRSYAYDALNLRIAETDELGFTTKFNYDANTNRTNVVDANGNITSYSYDALNRLSRQVYPDGSAKAFTYDANGNLFTRIDNNGVLTQYQYDKLNRLTTRTYPDNKKDSFNYDAIGRIKVAINNNATVGFNYDSINRILQEDLNGRMIKYKYNTVARTKNMTYPGGMKVDWQMDFRDRLTVINESGTLLASFKFDSSDRLKTKQYRNNTTTTYNYDSVNNVTRIKVTPNNLLEMNFTYDELNNRTLTERVNRPDFSEKYAYDNLSQLTKFESGRYANGTLTASVLHEFNYDALGNRMSNQQRNRHLSYSVNNRNQYKSILENGKDIQLSYDNNGNMLTDDKNKYTYDFENQLIGIKNLNSEILYKYDALGRRISKSTAGEQLNFNYDRWQLIEEQENVSNKSYIFSSGIDQVLFAKNNSSSWFYNSDLLNSVQSLTGPNGKIIEQYNYDPFGHPYLFDSNNIEMSSSSNNILFNGRLFDYHFYTYDFRSREMYPFIGRFLQLDKINPPDIYNGYLFVSNNPSNRIDPFGTYDYEISTHVANERSVTVTEAFLDRYVRSKGSYSCVEINMYIEIKQRGKLRDIYGVYVTVETPTPTANDWFGLISDVADIVLPDLHKVPDAIKKGADLANSSLPFHPQDIPPPPNSFERSIKKDDFLPLGIAEIKRKTIEIPLANCSCEKAKIATGPKPQLYLGRSTKIDEL